MILFRNIDQGRQVGEERKVAGRMLGGQRRGRPRAVVSDEIKATIIDHVVNRGLTLRGVGLRVQPNLQRSTVLQLWIFRNLFQNKIY